MLTYTQLLRVLRSTSFHLKLHLSLVPCKRLFLGTKQITTDRRARLGPVVFEELTIMKCAWSPKLYDVAAGNSAQVEEVDLPDFEFEQMLVDDDDIDKWVNIMHRSDLVE